MEPTPVFQSVRRPKGFRVLCAAPAFALALSILAGATAPAARGGEATTMAGRVVDADGRPVAGVAVTMWVCRLSGSDRDNSLISGAMMSLLRPIMPLTHVFRAAKSHLSLFLPVTNNKTARQEPRPPRISAERDQLTSPFPPPPAGRSCPPTA